MPDAGSKYVHLEMTGGIFLTADELVQMTGHKQPTRQQEWLARHCFRYTIRADGRPNVARQAVLEFHACTKRAVGDSSTGPDFSGL